jgi:glycine betaine/proline transport system permease protein
MEEWFESFKIPVGKWAAAVVDWMTDNIAWFFDGLASIFEFVIEIVLAALQAPPPLVTVAIFAGLIWWWRRSIPLVVFVVISLLFILNQGYWEQTTETLTLVVTSCLVCMGAGVPLGIWAAHNPKIFSVMRPILDLMQTLPTFVYLIPAIVFFGIGMVPGLIATAIFVLPAPIRLTHLGVSSTPRPLIEAAEAFGATPSQVLFKVELPYAMPQIMAGLTQTIMLSLSMVVIAALVGADGLGVPVVRALNTVNTALGFESGFVIVVLAILLDRVFRREDA